MRVVLHYNETWPIVYRKPASLWMKGVQYCVMSPSDNKLFVCVSAIVSPLSGVF